MNAFLHALRIGTCIAFGAFALGGASLANGPPTTVNAEAAPDNSFHDFDLILGSAVQSARFNILDFGDVPVGKVERAKLLLRNRSSVNRVLDLFAFGDYVSANWTKPNGRVNSRLDVPANGIAEIEVELLCTNVSTQRPQVIAILSNHVPVMSVLVAYLAHPAKLIAPTITTPPLTSGNGTSYGPWYFVSSGPSPYGYTYEKDSFSTSGSTPNNGHRACSDWVECVRVVANDTHVIYRFRIQGYQHDSTHHDSTVDAAAALTVTYRLKPEQAPGLKMRETGP